MVVFVRVIYFTFIGLAKRHERSPISQWLMDESSGAPARNRTSIQSLPAPLAWCPDQGSNLDLELILLRCASEDLREGFCLFSGALGRSRTYVQGLSSYAALRRTFGKASICFVVPPRGIEPRSRA